ESSTMYLFKSAAAASSGSQTIMIHLFPMTVEYLLLPRRVPGELLKNAMIFQTAYARGSVVLCRAQIRRLYRRQSCPPWAFGPPIVMKIRNALPSAQGARGGGFRPWRLSWLRKARS